MFENYNPDEIVRVKHLDEFARQLTIKLDGGTDPKISVTPSPSVASTACTYANGQATVTIPLSAVATSTRQFVVKPGVSAAWTATLTGMPQWTSTTSRITAYTWKVVNNVGQVPTNEVTVQLNELKAQTVIANLYYPETPTYDAVSIDFVITITE